MLGTAAFVVALEGSLLTSGPGQEGEKRDAGAGFLVIFSAFIQPRTPAHRPGQYLIMLVSNLVLKLW